MADHPQKDAHPAANTAGVPQAQTAQGTLHEQAPHAQASKARQTPQGGSAVPQGNKAAAPITQGAQAAQKRAAQPKRAPQSRALQGTAAPHSTVQSAATPNGKTAQKRAAGSVAGAPPAQTGARENAPLQASSQAPSDKQSPQASQTPTVPQDASDTKRTARETASSGTDATASVQQAPGGTKKAASSFASNAKARPHRRAQAESGQAMRNTTPLHSTAILQLEQIARSMQRGVNDGALVEAEAADRLPFRLIVNALGQILYRIGQQTEYTLLRVWHAVRRALHLATMGVVLLLRTFLRPIATLFLGIGRDLTSPFVRLFVGVSNAFQAMREASARGENPVKAGVAYTKQGLKTYRNIGLTALSYALPLAAAAVLALTVWSVLNTPFSLAVTYNDKMIGYVENEAVWESAKKKIRDRVRASSPDETFDARPQFNVVSVQVAARRNALEMVDIIISESSDQIQNAMGVYVGDTLAGVCTDGNGVQQMLDTTLSAARPADDPTARVQFVNSVTTERGLYFTDSISTLTQLESTLQASNWLQVKLIRTEVRNDIIEFETVEEENPSAYKGTTRVKQRGVNGEKTVTDDVSYINGVEVERVTLSEQITKEAVPKIVTVGTKEMGAMGSYNGSVIQGSGALLWPVPNYSYTTTEFGGHRGLDICAPYGTAVYACDDGTVIEAGWHWSWGYYVLIDHGNGITTRYAHNSSMVVAPGQNVSKGTLISYVGSTGVSSGNHCHLEITVNGGLVNPRRFVAP